MRILCLILILISSNLFGQDCTFYNVKMTFKGSVLSKASIKGAVKVPRLDFIRGKNNYAFKDIDEDYTILNNSFEIAIEDNSYDLHHLQYSRDFLPLSFTVIDLKGNFKVININIQKKNFEYKFLREGKDVQITFNLGEIKLE